MIVGQTIGPYSIIAKIGEGGMGEVYRARDTKLDRDVAIKVLPDLFARDSDRLARFEREAKAVATLSHPNILSIFDLGTDHGTAYAVTELLEGETLRGRLEAGALPQRKAVEYAGQIAAGLAAAHDKGIAHRDIKPENLFVTTDGRIKDPRLRSGSTNRVAEWRSDVRADGNRTDGSWNRPRHGGVHGARAGAGTEGRPSIGHLLARLRPPRDADRVARVSARDDRRPTATAVTPSFPRSFARPNKPFRQCLHHVEVERTVIPDVLLLTNSTISPGSRPHDQLRPMPRRRDVWPNPALNELSAGGRTLSTQRPSTRRSCPVMTMASASNRFCSRCTRANSAATS